MNTLSIGEAAEVTGTSVDTLRYYEKIGLLNKIDRDTGGRRFFNQKSLNQVHFIRRAQTMGFSLTEIGQLLDFRQAPSKARDDVRALAARKLKAIDKQIKELTELQAEFSRLITDCGQAENGCPIIESIEVK